MPRKVIIDCDPGIDDALARDDRPLRSAARNRRGDGDRRQRAGRSSEQKPARRHRVARPAAAAARRLRRPGESGLPTDARGIHGADGLGNLGLEVPELHHQHRAEKIILDEVRAAPEEVTIVCLGPLTNIARRCAATRRWRRKSGRSSSWAGPFAVAGDETPSAEFNIFCDPVAAREVLRAKVTKTLVPLDVLRQVNFSLEFIDQLPAENTRAGDLLRRLVSFYFRAYRQQLGLELFYLHEAIALLGGDRPRLIRDDPAGRRCGNDGRADHRGDDFRPPPERAVAHEHGSGHGRKRRRRSRAARATAATAPAKRRRS